MDCRDDQSGHLERADSPKQSGLHKESQSAKTINRATISATSSILPGEEGRAIQYVVYSLDRFSRKSADHHVVRGVLLGLGITLRSVTACAKT